MVEEWLVNLRINVNEQKCQHVTFSLRRKMFQPIKMNNILVSKANDAPYLGIHLDRKHISTSSKGNWLFNKNKVSPDNKILLYQANLEVFKCGVRRQQHSACLVIK